MVPVSPVFSEVLDISLGKAEISQTAIRNPILDFCRGSSVFPGGVSDDSDDSAVYFFRRILLFVRLLFAGVAI